MRFYLDTEFNGHGGELISLALVSPDGSFFYGVKQFDPPADPWVLEHVLPVLDLSSERPLIFKSRFQQFIMQYPGAEIICDWHADAGHFCALLEGNTYDSSLDFACTIKILKTPPGQPVSQIPHNALADARALMEWYETHLKERG